MSHPCPKCVKDGYKGQHMRWEADHHVCGRCLYVMGCWEDDCVLCNLHTELEDIKDALDRCGVMDTIFSVVHRVKKERGQ